MKPYNFSAGPSILPQYTFDKCNEALINFEGTGLSLIEVSHRSDEFVKVIDKAKSLVKELLAVPESYEVVFLHGGASMQFCMIPYNLLPSNKTAAYLDTGVWSTKAIKEAKLFGDVKIIGSSKDENYIYIPNIEGLSGNEAYLHITSNNTIYGTQLHQEMNAKGVPLVCDMSSDIFSQRIDVSKYDLIYAGAQKNLGPAGVCLVIVKKDILGKSGRQIPSMLDYQKHIDGDSMFNTPPVFAIYASLQTLKWIKQEGGVAEMERRNLSKSRTLYVEIDRNPLFEATANPKDASVMNVCFVPLNDSHLDEFLKFSSERGINGIKGHRSVGGFRASIYNAMPIEGVQKLVEVMQEFEKVKA